MITYEDRLTQNLQWSLHEGSMHFEKESAVHKTLGKIARKLEELGIPYAIAGGMALFFHGYRRFTEDVDILVTQEGLAKIHQQLEGLGYVPPFAGSKNLRDTESGVRIEFLVAGDYPGDGKPKPVAQASIETELIELKLASGMTNPRRAKDLVDVQELIDHLQLPESFASQLDPFVQDKFLELWAIIHNNPSDPDQS
jgi:hypothetical protein